MRRTASVAVALAAMASGLVSAVPATAAAGAPAAASSVDWTDCGTGSNPTMQCATVEVPLDYARPDGRQIAIAVNRIPATAEDTQGPLLVNPGGPGGSGLGLAGYVARSLPADVAAQYEPGSVLKVLTMAAGLEEGVVTPQSTLNDTGIVTVNGVPVRNWNLAGNGIINMTEVFLVTVRNLGSVPAPLEDVGVITEKGAKEHALISKHHSSGSLLYKVGESGIEALEPKGSRTFSVYLRREHPMFSAVSAYVVDGTGKTWYSRA